MDNQTINIAPVEYQVGGTKYTVVPTCTEQASKETLEEKVKRLILSDMAQSGLKP